jgi:ubiquinone/menaquinone biosynthesis C-methylase UbiE
MGFYDDHILPRCIDFMLSTPPILLARARVTSAAHGEVLEIGFGSGLNLPYYPPTVTKILTVDPSATGKKLASKRLAACSIPVEWSGLDGQRLAMPDASVDAVLSTFTMCTIPDLSAALAEVKRVLRPGGTLHFLEHGRSPVPNVAKWQDRLNPVQKRLFGGCHLNRAMDERLRAAGFEITQLETFDVPGPKVATHLYEGCAVVTR